MSRPKEFSNEEVFLSKMGMSKRVYGQANAAAPSQSAYSESLAKPEDFTLEEVFLSKMGMSKRVYGQANAAAPSQSAIVNHWLNQRTLHWKRYSSPKWACQKENSRITRLWRAENATDLTVVAKWTSTAKG